MKNRKAPVMLFGIVVVAIGGMAVLNAANRPFDPEAMQKQQEEAVHDHEPTKEEREATTQKAIDLLPEKAGSSQPATRPNDKKFASVEDMPGQSMEPATKPTILIEEYEPMRPKPNDTGTGSHWYNEESRAAKVAAQNAQERG